MRRLREAIPQKRTDLWKKPIMDFAQSAHTSILMHEFLAKNKIVIISQPPYSLDLGPADFFLFPKLKTLMKGKRFATIEEIKEKSKQEHLAIQKNEFQKCFGKKSAFQKSFENWKKKTLA